MIIYKLTKKDNEYYYRHLSSLALKNGFKITTMRPYLSRKGLNSEKTVRYKGVIIQKIKIV